MSSSNPIRDIQALLANLPGMVYRCRNETGWSMQYVSDGSVALCGYDPQELIDGEPGWTEIIHPDDRRATWNSVQRALKQNKSFEIQYRIQTKGEGGKWVMERGCAVDNDQDGTLVEGFISDITPLREKQHALEQAEVSAQPVDSEAYYAASVHDVSDRKTREAQVIRQSERMRATIEYAPIGIMTFNRDLCIVAANSAFAGMIGFEPDEILGRQFSAFAHPDEVAKTTEAALSSLAEDVTHYSMRTRYVHKDGHIVHAALHVALGCDDEGRPDFGVANIEDLTSSLSAAALIRDQRNERARIDRLSSLGEMTAGIAHEINQPLTAISTYAQAAVRFVDQGEIGSERLKEALTKLRKQSHRASSIVERIRALARQRKSRMELVDCSDLVRNTIELIADDTVDPYIEFRTELMSHLPFVLCDPAQLQQVVINLVRNAIESMQRAEFHGGKDIILKTEATDTGDVRIFVVDSGLGVDDSVSDTLFEPFSTNAATGLGMGLSTARSVLQSFGGKVEYRNNLSKGATFAITLPGHSGEISDEQSANSDNSR